MTTFHRLLRNTLASGITSSFLWFALTFWIYTESHSVVATGIVAGAFSICTALLGPVFGTLVDRHRKDACLMLTSVVATGCFAAAAVVFFAVPTDQLLQIRAPWFWVLVAFTLLGSVCGQMRGIVISTCVTLLVPEDERDKANGKVGTVTGLSFAATSLFSGMAIGGPGMGFAYAAAVVVSVLVVVDLLRIHIDEPPVERNADEPVRIFDIRAAITAVRVVPGLTTLLLLAGFNNLLTGVFMALLDAYGLSLTTVETWGLLFGIITLAFIASGMVVAKRGLKQAPMRIILHGNLAIWTACALFALRSSIVLVVIGLTVWLAMIPVIEAAEQTLLQKEVPFEVQGRVFGFAQLVENASAPVAAFLIAPLAESVIMPAMTDGWAAQMIGDWFGTGPDRGLALMFTVAGLVGMAVTLMVRRTRGCRVLLAA